MKLDYFIYLSRWERSQCDEELNLLIFTVVKDVMIIINLRWHYFPRQLPADIPQLLLSFP